MGCGDGCGSGINLGQISYCGDPCCKRCTPRRPRTEYALTYLNIDTQNVSDVVKATPGYLEGYMLANRSAVEIFIKLYDKTGSAIDPTVDVPKIVIPLQPKLEANLSLKKPLFFSRGIQIRACLGIANNDVVAPAANDVVSNIFYS